MDPSDESIMMRFRKAHINKSHDPEVFYNHVQPDFSAPLGPVLAYSWFETY
jgi:hypothetical protein